jgi:hypothetical protein
MNVMSSVSPHDIQYLLHILKSPDGALPFPCMAEDKGGIGTSLYHTHSHHRSHCSVECFDYFSLLPSGAYMINNCTTDYLSALPMFTFLTIKVFYKSKIIVR